ncbi:MAG: NlpC/P60 family protein [Hyphomicrobium sp.]|nr:NlpC/P60 family protein [Hyphomicrobium sp.]
MPIQLMPVEQAREVESQAIVFVARTWIGTPYHHQASVKGVGADCLGLVRGVYREVVGRETEVPPPYARDWGEADGRERLFEAAVRHLDSIAPSDAMPGDVLLFRMRPGAVAKHLGLVATRETMIHAIEGAAVAEVPLGSWWRRRITAVFRFPNRRD